MQVTKQVYTLILILSFTAYTIADPKFFMKGDHLGALHSPMHKSELQSGGKILVILKLNI